MKIQTTSVQKQLALDYLNGKISALEISQLAVTYMNEYIKIFGWESWQNDPIETVMTNFSKSII